MEKTFLIVRPFKGLSLDMMGAKKNSRATFFLLLLFLFLFPGVSPATSNDISNNPLHSGSSQNKRALSITSLNDLSTSENSKSFGYSWGYQQPIGVGMPIFLCECSSYNLELQGLDNVVKGVKKDIVIKLKVTQQKEQCDSLPCNSYLPSQMNGLAGKILINTRNGACEIGQLGLSGSYFDTTTVVETDDLVSSLLAEEGVFDVDAEMDEIFEESSLAKLAWETILELGHIPFSGTITEGVYVLLTKSDSWKIPNNDYSLIPDKYFDDFNYDTTEIPIVVPPTSPLESISIHIPMTFYKDTPLSVYIVLTDTKNYSQSSAVIEHEFINDISIATPSETLISFDGVGQVKSDEVLSAVSYYGHKFLWYEDEFQSPTTTVIPHTLFVRGPDLLKQNQVGKYSVELYPGSAIAGVTGYVDIWFDSEEAGFPDIRDIAIKAFDLDGNLQFDSTVSPEKDLLCDYFHVVYTHPLLGFAVELWALNLHPAGWIYLGGKWLFWLACDYGEFCYWNNIDLSAAPKTVYSFDPPEIGSSRKTDHYVVPLTISFPDRDSDKMNTIHKVIVQFPLALKRSAKINIHPVLKPFLLREGLLDAYNTYDSSKGLEGNISFTISENRGLPIIEELEPASGMPGTALSIKGINFADDQGSSTVTFHNNINATSISKWTDTEIVLNVSGNALTGCVTVTTASGKSNCSNFTVGDYSQPVITSGPSAPTSLLAPNSAVIVWTTDEPSDSVVEYGESSSYGMKESDGSFATNHSLVLTDIEPQTEYHYRVSSTDLQGNGPKYSLDDNFTTPAMSAAHEKKIPLYPDSDNIDDAYIEDGITYGSEAIIRLGNSSSKAGLIKFHNTDYSDILTNADIVSANIYLYFNGAGVAETIHAYEINQSWNEIGVPDNIWFDALKPAGKALTGTNASWVRFDITDLFAEWLDGSESNFGVLLFAPDASSTDSFEFISSDGIQQYRPYLYVTYNDPVCTEEVCNGKDDDCDEDIDEDLDCGNECYDSDPLDTNGDYDISEIYYGRYCANEYSWHESDVDRDGKPEVYMLVGETYKVWGKCVAEDLHGGTIFKIELDWQSVPCYDGSCNEETERVLYERYYASPSEKINYPNLRCWARKSTTGTEGLYDFYFGTLSTNQDENYLVLNCGEDADCSSGSYCDKPNLSNPMTYQCLQKTPYWPNSTGIQDVVIGGSPGEFVLKWNKAEIPRENEIYYNIYFNTRSPANDGYKIPRVTPDSDNDFDYSYTVSGLEQGTRYFFSIRAENRYNLEELNNTELSMMRNISQRLKILQLILF